MERKKEYQSLVSPIVRKGGRSKLIHRPTIKRKNTKDPNPVTPTATFR